MARALEMATLNSTMFLLCELAQTLSGANPTHTHYYFSMVCQIATALCVCVDVLLCVRVDLPHPHLTLLLITMLCMNVQLHARSNRLGMWVIYSCVFERL